MVIEIRAPKTENEFADYYQLRWEVLRRPWNQPKGGERDDLDNDACHVAAFDNGKVVGCGRLHFNSPKEAQIRYMAVSAEYQGKGIGTKILAELEKIARQNGAKTIIGNARDSALEFYKKYGFGIEYKSHTLFNAVPHSKIIKKL
jgi:N-acetylglutamate synthase-like GNAT family acetyltransferase